MNYSLGKIFFNAGKENLRYIKRENSLSLQERRSLDGMDECPAALFKAGSDLFAARSEATLNAERLGKVVRVFGGKVRNTGTLHSLFAAGQDDLSALPLSEQCTKAQEHDAALALAAAAVIETPQEALAWKQLGLCGATKGLWDLAYAAFSQALARGACEHYLLWHTGASALAVQRAQDAVEKLSASLKLNRDSPRVKPLLAMAYTLTGEYDKAEALLSDLESAGWPRLDGWIERRLGQVIKINASTLLEGTPSSLAHKLMDYANRMGFMSYLSEFALEYQHVSGLLGLRMRLLNSLQKNDIDTATATIEQIQAAYADQADSLPVVVGGFLGLGKSEDAVKAIIDRQNLDGQSLRMLIDEVQKHDIARSGDVYVALLEHYAHDTAILKDLVMGAHRAGAHDAALRGFKKARRAFPDDLEIAYAAAISAYMTGDLEQAYQDACEVLERMPTHNGALNIRAEILFTRGRFAESVRDLETAESHGSLSIERLLRLSVTSRAMADHDRAAHWAAMALKHAKKNAETKARAAILFFTEAALSQDTALLEQAVDIASDPRKTLGPGLNMELVCATFLASIGREVQAHDALKVSKTRVEDKALFALWYGLLSHAQPELDSVIRVPDDMQKMLTLRLGPERTFLLGLKAQKAGRAGLANRAFEALAGDVCYGGFAACQRGRQALLDGDYVEATQWLDTAAEQVPWKKSVREERKTAFALARKRAGALPRVAGPDYEAPAIVAPFPPLITIGVSVFNEARFLADALNSVWLQSFPFWECIIVDDRSSDESYRIAKAYTQMDPRFRLVRHKKNSGLSAARNTALRHAKSPYVTFLDGDDYLSQNSLLSRYCELQRSGIDDDLVAGAHCSIVLTREMGFARFERTDLPKRSGIKSSQTCRFEAPFNAHAPLLKTALMRQVNGFDETMLGGAEDWDCWIRLMRQGYRFIPTNTVGAFYREKRNSMVRSGARTHYAAAEGIYKSLISPSGSDDQSAPRPVWLYEPLAGIIRRGIRFAAMAAMARQEQQFCEIITALPKGEDIYRIGDINIETLVREGVLRFLTPQGSVVDGIDRKSFVERRVLEISQQIRDILAQIDPNADDGWTLHAAPAGKSKDKGQKPQIISAVRPAPAYIALEERDSDKADCKKLMAFRNIHKGERCFIVGNGPSLNKLDLGLLKDEHSIAVNGIFYKTGETGYRPTYYVVEDSSVMRENIERIIAYDVQQKFFPTLYRRLHPERDNVNFFAMNRGFYEVTSPNYCVPRFSTDFSQRAYCGQSVTFINLQLAFYMGFSEVYLIGMDFSYQVPKEFDVAGDIITSTGDDPNHFHPDYFGKGKTWKKPKLERVLANYKAAKLAYESVGRKIYNATAGGQLELFDRVAYDSLFE